MEGGTDKVGEKLEGRMDGRSMRGRTDGWVSKVDGRRKEGR